MGLLSGAVAAGAARQRAEDCGAGDIAQAAGPHPPGLAGQSHLTY